MGYNPDENRAIIEHKGHALDVATDLLDTFSYNTKDLLQCIGELEYKHDVSFFKHICHRLSLIA